MLINGKETKIRKMKVKELKNLIKLLGIKVNETFEFLNEPNFLSQVDSFLIKNFEDLEAIILPFFENVLLEDIEEMDIEDFKELIFKILEVNGIKREVVKDFFIKISPKQKELTQAIQFAQTIPK